MQWEKTPYPFPRPQCRHDRVKIVQTGKHPTVECLDCDVVWSPVPVTDGDKVAYTNGFTLSFEVAELAQAAAV